MSFILASCQHSEGPRHLPLILTDAPTAPETSETVMRSSVEEKPSMKSSNCETSLIEPDFKVSNAPRPSTHLEKLSERLLLGCQCYCTTQ